MGPRAVRSAQGDPKLLPEPAFVQTLFTWLAPRYEQALVLYTLGLDLLWKHRLLVPIRPSRSERTLDLACGTGLILERLERRVGDNGAVGLDANRAMLRVRGDHAPTFPRVQASAEALPFRTGTFDVLTAGYLPKYVQLDRLAHEVHRVLRPGGRFGAYDFSRPTRGLPGRAYALYLGRVLPWLGRRRHRASPMWPTMLQFLAEVAIRSGWEGRIGTALQAAGFEEIRIRSALGGSVTWVWAVASKGAPMSGT